jgi:chromodomain-helicase-DNA-binding protein 1
LRDDDSGDFQIWLKDKNKKPQAKHIQARADYLLKYLAKHVDIKKIRHRQPTKPTNNTVDVNDGAIIKVVIVVLDYGR